MKRPRIVREQYRVFQKELCSGIPNVTMWTVLQKRLPLKAYKLFIVQGVERWITYKRFRNTRHTVTFGIKNEKVKVKITSVTGLRGL
jgi:type IV secretory pathway TrbF-like protein